MIALLKCFYIVYITAIINPYLAHIIALRLEFAVISFKFFFVRYVCTFPLKKRVIGLVTTPEINDHKNLLGSKNWRAVDVTKHCQKRVPLNVVLEEEVVVHPEI